MPQSGDGDLWPTTDDDKPRDLPSAPVKDTVTHASPVQDKEEEPAAGGWFDPPTADEPEPGRDKSHAKPAQQRTQPVSWRVAELERQVANPDAEKTVFVRPVQLPAGTSPSWPDGQDSSAGRDAKTTQSGKDEPAAAEPAQNGTPDEQPAPAEPVEATAADEPASGDTPDQPEAGESGHPEPASQDVDAPEEVSEQPDADRAEQESVEPEHAVAENEIGEPEATSQAADFFRPRPPEPDPATSWFGAQEDSAPAEQKDSASSGATVNLFTPTVEPADTGVEGEQGSDAVAGPLPLGQMDSGVVGNRPPIGQVDPDRTVVNFAPVSRPGDSTTVHISRPTPDLPAPRDRVSQDAPPSFIRPRPGESTTVIPKPDQQRPDQYRPDRGNEWPPPEPPRAAPQRVGPPPPEPPAARKPKKRLLITAVAIVAVLGVAAGVVFGVPGVAEKLGLTSEDAVAIDPPPAPITYTPGLHGPDASAPAPTQQGVEQALAGPLANSALGTLTGVVIDPTTGETLYQRDAGDAVTPASTGKLITAAAALLSLDHTQQLVTKVVQGDQPGEVIIVGGGDPTISSLKVGNESMYPGAAHLSDLVDQVKASGATVSTVYVDESRYTGPGLATSWLPADVVAGYIAPIVPAMLDGDRQDATKNYSPRTNDPGKTLVNEFATRIGATAGSSVDKKAPANAKVLGEIRSAPVAQLVDNMLDRSENTLGDILAREVAVKTGKEPSFDGATAAMLDVLRQNNFDVDGAVLKDGSGMSTENKVSAKLLAQILAVAAAPDGKDPRTAKLRPLLGGLPVAGGSGTLADRYTQGAAAEGKGWVRAKTGTLTGVNSLAGIVLDKDNRPLVFAFLTTGTNGSTARPALDTVSAALRGCGCQS